MGQPHNSGFDTAADLMRKKFYKKSTASAVILVAALLFSCTAQAVTIGEVVSQSKLGEPLRTQIELMGSGMENIQDVCLSLLTPDASEEGARDFVTAARLAIKTEGRRKFVIVSSHRPYDNPFLRIKLQIKCMEVGNVVKTFTILPDFSEALPVVAPSAVAEVSDVAASSSSAGLYFRWSSLEECGRSLSTIECNKTGPLPFLR